MGIFSMKVDFNDVQREMRRIEEDGGKVVSVFPYHTIQQMRGTDMFVSAVVIVYREEE